MKRRSSAFTLIELLVVVAIIALLISILLPSLAQVKEEGRKIKCLSNLRSIGLAANGYLNESKDDFVFAFPFDYRLLQDGQSAPTSMAYGLITETIWGGGVPDKTAAEYQAAGVATSFNPASIRTDVIWTRPKYRPMNRFMSSSVSWDDARRFGNNAERTNRKMDLPDSFKCPSDNTAPLPEVNRPNNDIDGNTPFSTWEYWGTSYPINWYWPYYFWDQNRSRGVAAYGPSSAWGGVFDRILAGRSQPPLRSVARDLLKDKSGRWASEFILFYENRFNYAMANAAPRGVSNATAKSFAGWHKRRDYHAAGFLDGSASYRKYDTRYIDGPGWTTWPNRPWLGGWTNVQDN